GLPPPAGGLWLTGLMVAAAFSAQSRIFLVMAVLGRPGVSDAPTTATVRGWKKVSRSTARSSTGRPVTSRRTAVGCRAVGGMRLLTIMTASSGRGHADGNPGWVEYR